jgi:predicted nucleic acid-binding Zn finger protein
MVNFKQSEEEFYRRFIPISEKFNCSWEYYTHWRYFYLYYSFSQKGWILTKKKNIYIIELNLCDCGYYNANIYDHPKVREMILDIQKEAGEKIECITHDYPASVGVSYNAPYAHWNVSSADNIDLINNILEEQK